MEIVVNAIRHLQKVAVVSHITATRSSPAQTSDVRYDCPSVRYGQVLSEAVQVQRSLSSSRAWPRTELSKSSSGAGPRVAVFLPSGPQYLSATWATWLAGGTVVPLCLSHPDRELEYVLEDSSASMLLTSAESAPRMAALAKGSGCTLLTMPEGQVGEALDGSLEEAVERRMAAYNQEQGGLIIYTSGTTGRPKGALHRQRSVMAQVSSLLQAWEWQADDRILHCLPLHHVHGIVNALYCPTACGATVEVLPKFSPRAVWNVLMREEDPVSVFMGVPTMYAYLLNHFDHMDPEEQQKAREAAARLRLTVSGSAACPVPIMQRWEQLSGVRLLERYGMTEIGMALSNPLHGERRAGYVGLPLPGVEVKVEPPTGPGELLVRGPSLFSEYWGKPEATLDAFNEEGYFKTGDTVELSGSPPYWRILGRSSVDIIKSGGYKMSALDIENVLLEHPSVGECAVLGLPHLELGEEVAAVIALKNGEPLSLEDLCTWAQDKLPKYQIPRHMKTVDALPRNVMGKINKKELRANMFPAVNN